MDKFGIRELFPIQWRMLKESYTSIAVLTEVPTPNGVCVRTNLMRVLGAGMPTRMRPTMGFNSLLDQTDARAQNILEALLTKGTVASTCTPQEIAAVAV